MSEGSPPVGGALRRLRVDHYSRLGGPEGPPLREGVGAAGQREMRDALGSGTAPRNARPDFPRPE